MMPVESPGFKLALPTPTECRLKDLRDQLQETLGVAYTLEHELGGGGMSRVFVAEDTALGRKVVIKILPPELAAAVNLERFKREIQLAAKLSTPTSSRC
jgi:serine/threonine-protein kinase